MIPKNKKIALLHPYVKTIGGAVKMMIFLGNFLQDKGNQVCFFTTLYDEKLFSKEIKFPVKVGKKIQISYQIKDYDYIIIGNSPMQFVGVLSKILFLSKAKVLWWHHHYPWYYEKNTGFKIFLKRYLEKFSLNFIDLLIGNSIYIKKSLESIYKNKKVELLNPIVDYEFLNYKNKNKQTLSQKTIFSYSRWVKGKNLKQIFDTYDFIENKIDDFNFIIGGDGEELEFYKQKYKGKKNIDFLGVIDKKTIIENLEKSSVFLFPSQIDSFGISALESIFVGAPVVAFDVKGVKEIVKNGQNGFLVSTSDEFSKKTLEILEGKTLNIRSFMLRGDTVLEYGIENFELQLENIFLRI